jgi:AcrR family transcriptional regulator
MKEPDRPAHETQERILAAACRLFAEKGYRGTTVALLCREAGANIAAVNYHFGGKEELYRRAWRHAHEQLLALVPPEGGVAAERPAAERLRGRIRAGLQRALMGKAVELNMVRNEMAHPTGLLDQVIEDAIRPIRQETQALLRELLGPRATDLDVELCEICVVAPWMHMMHHRQAEKHQGVAPVFREEMLDAMTERLTAFALAGIRETRRQVEGRGRKTGGRSRK